MRRLETLEFWPELVTLKDELSLRELNSAKNTPATSPVLRAAGRLLRRLAPSLLSLARRRPSSAG